MRSPTAAEIWKESHPDDETKYIGIRNFKTNKGIREMIDWAGHIFVMEGTHARELSRYTNRVCTVLDIKDSYTRGQTELKDLLRRAFSSLPF